MIWDIVRYFIPLFIWIPRFSDVYLNERSILYFLKYHLLCSSPLPFSILPELSISGNASNDYLLNYSWTVRCVTLRQTVTRMTNIRLTSSLCSTFSGLNLYRLQIPVELWMPVP